MSRVRPAQPSTPAAPRGILCPYCGRISVNPKRCDGCGGFFDPLSRQATQNAMGPWFVRDPANPNGPGCSYETLKEFVKRGRIRPDTILRGPTTRQFWNFAARTPTVANLLGLCHNCHSKVSPEDYSCAACGAVFTPETDRQHLGLAPVHLLPGQAAPEIIAASVQPPPDLTQPGPAARPPRARPLPREGESAIVLTDEPAGGGAVGKTLAVLGILVLVIAAVAGVIYITQQLNPSPPAAGAHPAGTPAGLAGASGSPASTPSTGTPPAGATGPMGSTPGAGAAPQTGATGPAAGSGAPTPTAPTPQTGAEHPSESPQPSPEQSKQDAPKGPTGELSRSLLAAPDENAVLNLLRQAAGSPDPTAWEALIHRREEQFRLRGLP